MKRTNKGGKQKRQTGSTGPAREGEVKTVEYDEKIDYTEFLRDKPQETDPEKIDAMDKAVKAALLDRGIHRAFTSYVYYADGHVKVSLCGKFYGVFDCKSGEFFSGYVGEDKHSSE